ncbi:MAG: regulatory protein RecX [Actinobacteria bacterium]|nr:regulatory protein RecX [Actinomycetota bacterium]
MAAAGRQPTPADDSEIPGDPEQSLGDPESVARAICLRLLTQRARSRAELAEALARRDVPEPAARHVLDRFAEVGLIDDAALAQGLAGAQHRERGLARRAVVAKLRQRGLGDEVVNAAVEGIDGVSERSRAKELVERRLRSMTTLAPDVQARRLIGLLGRKGYSPGLAYAVVRETLGEQVDDREE